MARRALIPFPMDDETSRFPPPVKRPGGTYFTKTWWSPLWRGLVADPKARHYQRLRSSIYLLLFCILHADRRTGTLYRKLPTIALEMGMNVHTIRRWLATLRKHGYVTTKSTGRALRINVQKWKPITAARDHQPRAEVPSQ